MQDRLETCLCFACLVDAIDLAGRHPKRKRPKNSKRNRLCTVKQTANHDQNLVSKAETLCVLPPYSSPASIKNHLSEKQFSYLERRINTFIGLDDRIWWLIALKQNGTVDAYRMSASARPHFKSGKCLENTSAFITFDHGNGHYLFFNFSAGA